MCDMEIDFHVVSRMARILLSRTTMRNGTLTNRLEERLSGDRLLSKLMTELTGKRYEPNLYPIQQLRKLSDEDLRAVDQALDNLSWDVKNDR